MQARRGDEKDAIDLATTTFPALADRLGQQAGSLSGGEQQMLAMAAAFVIRPQLILVDEPSLGLAPAVVDAVFGFLEGAARRGIALLIVDQYVTRALDLASWAYVLRGGKIVYSGGSNELLDGDLFSQYFGTEQ